MGFFAEQRLAGLPRARIAACVPGTDRQGKAKKVLLAVRPSTQELNPRRWACRVGQKQKTWGPRRCATSAHEVLPALPTTTTNHKRGAPDICWAAVVRGVARVLPGVRPPPPPHHSSHSPLLPHKEAHVWYTSANHNIPST
jgi:hypothetical protein